MNNRLMICLLASALLAGCSAKQTPRQASTEWQRFLPVNVEPFGGGLALDTKTGQLCRTWNLQLNFEVIRETPLCKALYDLDAAKN